MDDKLVAIAHIIAIWAVEGSIEYCSLGNSIQ